MPSRIIHTFIGSMCLFSMSGCDDSTVKTYQVSGIVKFEDGQPVPHGVVEFRAGGSAPVARGKIGSDGRFTLGTFSDADGAVEGLHNIIVVQHAIIDSAVNSPDQVREHASHKTVLVDPKFASYDTSELRAEVKPDAENFLTLSVRRFSVGNQEAR